jgi:hypothetical protein
VASELVFFKTSSSIAVGQAYRAPPNIGACARVLMQPRPIFDFLVTGAAVFSSF